MTANACPICGFSLEWSLASSLGEFGDRPAHKRCIERRRLLIMGSWLGADALVPMPGSNRALRIRFVTWQQYKGRTTPNTTR